MTLLRSTEANLVGCVILATELKRLYILDSYGHSIMHARIMPFTPSILLAHGSYVDKYVIICIGREGEMCLYMQKDKDEPSEILRTSSRILSASLSFPDLLLVGADQTVTYQTLSNSTFTLLTKKHALKLGSQPLGAEWIKVRGQKMSLIVLEKEVRLYN